ncbi:YOR378W-like protein [Microthyrium microscopicum]|uniref:YOR378W-like protein n=1 Tax=Microthyrium microscopicum TaxID=703497 RepID=A0A6A6UG39_9PEZI|nr:YOR378W-like protein [Microthyrium microscopicum]
MEQPGPPSSGIENWPRWRTVLFIIVVCAGQFMSLAALGQTVAAQNIMGVTFGTENPALLSWFTAAYSLTLGTFILPAGRLGDMYGHKKIFLLGWLWTSFWSSLVGFAHTWGPVAFCAMRGLQGMGPAFLVPNAIAIICRTWPMGPKRGMVISLNGAMGPTGFVTGALFSSILAEYAWWPWCFWAMALVSTIITFLAYCIVPDELAKPATPPGVRPPTFDWIGCITGVSGLILINFALNQAPLVGWNTPYIYFTFILGFLIIIFFIYAEFRVTGDPLVPVRGLQPQAIMALGCIAAGWASHGIWLYFFFLFMIDLRHESPLLATGQLAWVVPIGIAFALSTGWMIKKIHVSRVLLLAMLFFFIGTLFLAFAPINQTYWGLTFISVIVMPGGMNLSFPAGVMLLSNAMPREHQGKAASLVGTVVNYSIASGLGIAGMLQKPVNVGGMNPLLGFRAAWYLGSGFSGLGVVIALYFVWKSRQQL